MKELETEILKSFNGFVESGALNKIIEKQVHDTVDGIVKDQLGQYSTFGKAVKTAVETSLKIDCENLGLAGYNDVVLKVVKERINHHINVIGNDRLTKDIDELLQGAPSEIKVSEMVKVLKESNHDSNRPYECTCIVESRSHSSTWVYFDTQPDIDIYKCSHNMLVCEDGRVFCYSISRQDPSKKLFVGNHLDDFERLLFQMYCAKTKVVLDADAVDREYQGVD